MRLDLDEGVAGWVARSGQPALVPAVREDDRYYQGVDQKTGFQTQAIMAVPIRLGDKTIGVIEAINPQQDRLEESDVKLLASVAILAASAIQNARHFTRARDAEQRYATLFEDSADPIIITDASGTINDVNLTLCEMLEYEKDALLGLDLASLFEDSKAIHTRLERALEGESIFCNAQIMARDGTLVPFEVRAARVFHNNQPYVQWLCHDLSERHELEQMRQDLTNMIIHDLRNPLSSVMSSLELIRTTMNDDSVDIPIDQLFNVAHRSGERLYLLIDSILDMARLEDGQTDLDLERLDVQNMVAEVVEQLQPMVTSRELDLTYHISPDLSPVWGDGELLQRVLLNLLDNAIKFTMAEGEIGVNVDQLDEETVLFSVWDTGQGIPPEYHERIFDRFARARQDDSPGTGLGLSLCKLAVEAHGGRIWVESEPDVEPGSVFKFTLPVKLQEATET
jgi:PAS domain S-box-containing protein